MRADFLAGGLDFTTLRPAVVLLLALVLPFTRVAFTRLVFREEVFLFVVGLRGVERVDTDFDRRLFDRLA